VNVPGELAKLPAFVRRDVRIALSYRMAALGGLLALAMQAVVFSFIGKLVDPAQLPTFIGTRATYMEFVTIGIGLNMVVLLMVHQLATAIRGEQMIGTLESLLVTPTRTTTIQVGSATFELLYIPLRIGILVALIAILFGLDFHASGIAQWHVHHGSVPAVAAGEQGHHRAQVFHVPCHRTDLPERFDPPAGGREVAGARQSSRGRLDGGDPTEGGRQAHAPCRVAAQTDGSVPDAAYE